MKLDDYSAYRIQFVAQRAARIKSAYIVPTIYDVILPKDNEDYDLFDFIETCKLYVPHNVPSTFRINQKLSEAIINNGNLHVDEIRTMLYIGTTLPYNSNIYVVDYESIGYKLNCTIEHAKTIIHSICYRKELNVLVRTNKPNTYIVNHNLLFNGDVDLFAVDYNMLYGNRKGELNDNGKVIITNY